MACGEAAALSESVLGFGGGWRERVAFSELGVYGFLDLQRRGELDLCGIDGEGFM